MQLAERGAPAERLSGLLSILAFSSGMIAIFARNLAHPLRVVVARRSFVFDLALLRIAATSEQRATLHGNFVDSLLAFLAALVSALCSFFSVSSELGKLVPPGESGCWQDAKLIASTTG